MTTTMEALALNVVGIFAVPSRGSWIQYHR